MNKQIVIDVKAILVFLGIIVGLFLALQVKAIIIALFISLIITLGLTPAVDFLKKRKVPHSLSVLLVYFGALITTGALIALALVPMLNDTIALINNFPKYLGQLTNIKELEPITKNLDQKLVEQLSNVAGNVASTTVSAVTGLLMLVTSLVFTAYMLMDFDNIRNLFLGLFPKKQRENIKSIILDVEKKLSFWLRGQLTLMIIVGLLSYLGLFILGVPYAMSLALIAGILEMLPMVGPTVALVTALIVGFSTSPIHGIGVLGLYLLIQQLENNLIVPKVMQKAVGFNPLATMITIIVGGTTMGIIGALLAVPTTLVVVTVTKHFFKRQY